MGRIEEFLVVFFVGLLLFGPHKLKDIASSLGGALNEFKKAMNPEGQNAQATPAQATATHHPVHAKAPARRRKPAVKKMAKATR